MDQVLSVPPTERERRIQLADALSELLTVLNSDVSLSGMLEHVLERMTRLLDSDAATVYLLDSHAGQPCLRLAASRGLHPDSVAPRLDLGAPVSGLATVSGRPAAMTDILQAIPTHRQSAEVIEDRGSHLLVRQIGRRIEAVGGVARLRRLARSHPAVLAVPLVARDDIYGAVTVYHRQARQFSDEYVELATAFAAHAALAIQNSRLREGARRRSEELAALYQADERMHQSLQSDRVLQALADVAAEMLAADRTVVWTWNPAARRVVVGAGHALSAAFRAESYAPDEADIMAAVANSDVVVMEDVQTDPRMNDRLRQRDAREGVNAWLSATIRIGGEIFGSFSAGYRQSRTFGDSDRRIVQALAQRAAVALQNANLYEHAQRAATENARLHEESDRRARELEALYRADELLYRSLRLDQVLQTLVDVAADVLKADMTSVLVWDERHEMLVPGATRGFQPETVALMAHRPGQGITGTVAEGGEPVAIEDVANDPRVAHRITDAEGIRSLLHVPITVEGAVFGVFGVSYRQQRILAGEEMRVLLALAHRAALAIENASLYAESERRRDELEALYRADETLHSSLRLDDVLETLADLAMSILHSDSASVWMLEPKGQLVMRTVRGLAAATLAEMDSVAASEQAAIVQEAVNQDVVEVEDVRADPRFPADLRALNDRMGIRASLSGRIRSNIEVFGTFAVGFGTARKFREEERRLIVALGQRAALAIQNARLFEQAQAAATAEERQRLARELHDAVTQTLFSASLIAEVVPRMWERNPEEARRRLEELRRLTRGALAEMRTLLVELRPMALVETPLSQLVGQFAEAIASRSNLRVAVSTEGDPRALPAEVQVALYRVVQEVFNNTTKHANAQNVCVKIAWTADGVELDLSDDGHGFQMHPRSPGHFGLDIMAERARSIGARLNIDSQPGRGTRVGVRWQDSQA